MATFIVDTLGEINGAVSIYAETVFSGVGGSVRGVILAAGLVGLPLLAFNAIMQFHPIRMSQFVTWGIRYVIILAVATSWAQFQPIYRILTEVPNSYGGALLSATGFGVPTTGGLNAAMDEMVTSIYAYSDRANEESGILSIGLAGFALWLLGSLMACVAIIISAIAKIGLAMATSLAPIAIASMMFRATSQFFESWSRFTLGFALPSGSSRCHGGCTKCSEHSYRRCKQRHRIVRRCRLYHRSARCHLHDVSDPHFSLWIGWIDCCFCWCGLRGC